MVEAATEEYRPEHSCVCSTADPAARLSSSTLLAALQRASSRSEEEEEDDLEEEEQEEGAGRWARGGSAERAKDGDVADRD